MSFVHANRRTNEDAALLSHTSVAETRNNLACLRQRGIHDTSEALGGTDSPRTWYDSRCGIVHGDDPSHTSGASEFKATIRARF